MMPPFRRFCGPAQRATRVVTLIALALLGGCARYQVGLDSLYRPDIRTVYVPMIETDTYRRDIGERLTEAVVRQIESRTPYKVVGSPDADSVLNCRLVSLSKYLKLVSPTDEGRELKYDFQVMATWVRRGEVVGQTAVGLPPEAVDIYQGAHFVPEYGQSNATAQQDVINRVAQQVVDLMEVRWPGGDG